MELQVSPLIFCGELFARKVSNSLKTLEKRTDAVFDVRNDVEEELYVSGNTVIWSQAGVVQRCFTRDQNETVDISQVLWAHFPLKTGLEKALVIIYSDNLIKTHFLNGSTYVSQCPFRIQKAWALSSGIAIARDAKLSSRPKDFLYFMKHPLDELKIPEWNLEHADRQIILCVDKSLLADIVITCDVQEKIYSFWEFHENGKDIYDF